MSCCRGIVGAQGCRSNLASLPLPTVSATAAPACLLSMPAAGRAGDDAALLLAWAPELFAVMALSPSPCAGYAVTGQVWTMSFWFLAPAGSADKQQLWQRNQERFASAQQSEPEQPALLEHLDSYIVRQTGWRWAPPGVQAPPELHT